MTITALIVTGVIFGAAFLQGGIIASPRGRVATPARFWVGMTLMLVATAGVVLATLGVGAA